MQFFTCQHGQMKQKCRLLEKVGSQAYRILKYSLSSWRWPGLQLGWCEPDAATKRSIQKFWLRQFSPQFINGPNARHTKLVKGCPWFTAVFGVGPCTVSLTWRDLQLPYSLCHQGWKHSLHFSSGPLIVIMDSTDDGTNPTVSLDTSCPLGNMGEKHAGYACTVRCHRVLPRSSVSVPRLSALHLSWAH